MKDFKPLLYFRIHNNFFRAEKRKKCGGKVPVREPNEALRQNIFIFTQTCAALKQH